VTDPILLLRNLLAESPWVCVGGDAGGGFTKLGVTFVGPQQRQKFLPLLVVQGSDHYESLRALRVEGLTQFKGASEAHTDIFSVLQQLIDRHNAFLNGDWPFLCALLGLKGPSSTFPCPICTVGNQDLLRRARLRAPHDQHSVLARDSPALLKIKPQRIVPTPLHPYLGINNRIIFLAYTELIGEETVVQLVQQSKSKHSAGCGGLSDIHSLNGPELARFIRQNRSAEQLCIGLVQSQATARTRQKLDQLATWMQKLHKYLLHSEKWKATDLFIFKELINDIYKNWVKTTADRVFPKLHMLRHAVEFAQRHEILGAASESQIESFHSAFNHLYNFQHRNTLHEPLKQIRRCLADSVVGVVGPMLAGSLAEPAKSLLALSAPPAAANAT
jgi:hypothetical protein